MTAVQIYRMVWRTLVKWDRLAFSTLLAVGSRGGSEIISSRHPPPFPSLSRVSLPFPNDDNKGDLGKVLSSIAMDQITLAFWWHASFFSLCSFNAYFLFPLQQRNTTRSYTTAHLKGFIFYLFCSIFYRRAGQRNRLIHYVSLHNIGT